MAAGDIYEVVDVQALYEQQVLNVYFYEQRGAFVPLSGTVAQNLAEEWNESILPTILPFQHPALTHVETRVRNLFDATDAGVSVSGIPGTASSATDALPGFVATGFSLKTDNASIRPGAKRIAVQPESYVTDGVLTGGALTQAAAIADVLAAPITGGLIITDDIMFPVVVKRVRSGSPGTYEYRLPETSGEAVVGTIIEALFDAVVTSQISRKIGVGL